MASEQPTKPSVSELLRTVDEDVDGLVLCTKCGHQNKEGTRLCGGCGNQLRWPTLGECGKNLPIGIEENGKLIKPFDLKPLDWKLEKQIGDEWKGRRDQITVSDYVGTILSYTVTTIGDMDLQKHKFPKRLLIFNQMYSADVFYIYAYLRLISLGSELKVKDTPCPSCGHKFLFVADLTSIEVVTATDPSKLIKKVTLRDGFELAGERRFEIRIKPTRWNMMGNQFGDADTDAQMFAVMLMNALDGVEGLPEGATITQREIEQFSKYDMAIIDEEMDEVLCGPRWEIEGKCPQCHADFFHLINWGYESFFSISSRSPRQRRRSRT